MGTSRTHRRQRPSGRGWGSFGLWLLLSGVVVSSPVVALAPPEVLFSLSAKDFSAPAHSITLPQRWKYHPGDDLGFAALDLDDSAWEEVDTRLTRAEMPSTWSGLGWFRLRLRVDPSLQAVPLGILLDQVGAAEIYLDGRRLFSLGTVATGAGAVEPSYQRQPYLFTFSDRTEHVLAIRYCNHQPRAYDSVGKFGGFQVTLGEANQRVTVFGDDLETLSAYQAFFTGVFASFALLHLLLFVFYREAAENLYFALLSSAVALLVYIFLHNYFTTDPEFFFYYPRAMHTTRLLLSVFALRFVYSVFYSRLPRTFWLVLVSASVLVVPGWIWPLAWEPWGVLLLLATSVEMIRAVVVAIYRKKAGAWVVGVGILTLALGISVGLLASLRVLPESIVTLFLMPFGSMFVLMVTMSVYLSRQFARTNRELREQLLQVKELSRHNLEQERQARDAAVERTRLEAEYKVKVAELEEARRLQLSMLPEDLPDLPDVELAADMKTATEVGGDYYDFDLAHDGTLTIAIGDATGHGIKAGTMVAATKSLFNAMGDETDLLKTLDCFTRALKRMNLRQLSMALTLAKFKAGRLRLAAAGMPPPLVYRAASSHVETLALEGAPLGSLTGYPYRESEIDLDPGDTVLFMSDGFPERLNGDDEMLGYDNITQAFSETAMTSPQAIIDQLMDHGEVWANGKPPQDDITFVVLKMREPVAARRASGSVGLGGSNRAGK